MGGYENGDRKFKTHSKYELVFDDFIPAAKHIAQKEPPVHLDETFMEDLDKAIRYREKAEDNHRAFIQLLRDVRWILLRRSDDDKYGLPSNPTTAVSLDIHETATGNISRSNE
ncbi:hypothetical protein PG993_005210 [Apiospora rasikravindrae]|uniref:DUF6604 domain-containing protein n=1 Tax=Apiospora rasikravindrae TaxID=990691 RepID=A0ABR1TGU3_9PEZI